MTDEKRRKTKQLRHFLVRHGEKPSTIFFKMLIRLYCARVIAQFFQSTKCLEVAIFEFRFGKIGGAI